MKRCSKGHSAFLTTVLLLTASLSCARCVTDAKLDSPRSPFASSGFGFLIQIGIQMSKGCCVGRQPYNVKDSDIVVVLTSSDEANNRLKKPQAHTTYVLDFPEFKLKKTIAINAASVAIVGEKGRTKVICPKGGDGFRVRGEDALFEQLEFTECEDGSALRLTKTKKALSAENDGGGDDADEQCIPNAFVKDCEFVRNAAESSPAFHVSQRCVKVEESSFIENYSAKSLAGGIFAKDGGVIVHNVTFEGNVGKDGAAINLQHANLWIEKSRFIANTARNQGGAIFAGDRSKIIVTESMFQENVANETAGAIKVQKQSELKSLKTNFTLNSANDTGGAIVSANSIIEIVEAQFTENNATKRGGGIEVYTKTKATLKAATFTRNSAGVGGALYSHDSSVDCVGIFSGNNGIRDGGAIYAVSDSVLSITSSTFDRNSAQFTGGAISVNGITDMTITNSRFFDNSVYGRGGSGAGVSVTDTETVVNNTKFELNEAKLKGGAIDVHGSSEMLVMFSVFSNNSARMGAAVSDRLSKLTVQNSTFEENQARYEGGAIYADGSTLLKIEESEFSGNSADFYAGAVKLMKDCIATIKDSSFKKNRAAYRGGALAAHKTKVNVTDTVFEENFSGLYSGAMHVYEKSEALLSSVILANNSAEIGGASRIRSASSMKVRRCRVETNVGRKQAGGFSVAVKSTLDILESIVDGNSASGSGGGVKVDSKSFFNATTVKIRNNVANKTGGGVAGYESNLTFSDVSFLNNVAGNHGGAIEVYLKSHVTIEDSEFEKNSAEKGGSVTHWDSVVKIKTSRFLTNSASIKGGAIFSALRSELIIEDSSFSRNAATEDGGALAAGNCLLSIKTVQFSENHAKNRGGAISWKGNSDLSIYEAQFRANEAKDGGAIDIDGSDSIIEATQFEYNTVNADGGALCLSRKAYTKLNAVVLTDNTASRGGAIYVNGSKLEVNDTTFETNGALETGGAIETAALKSEVRILRCAFDDNEARDAGGAIYLAPSSHLHVNETNFTRNNVVTGAPGNPGGTYQNNRQTLTINAPESVMQSQSQYRRSILTTDRQHSISREGDLESLSPLRTTIEARQARNLAQIEEDGSLDVENVVNFNLDETCATLVGGAIAAACPKTMIVDATRFVHNIGNRGGGIGIIAGEKEGVLHVKNTTFDGNRAMDGAGMYIQNGLAVLTIKEDVVFENNLAIRGGGMCLVDSADLKVGLEHGKPLRLQGNAAYYGGGLFCEKCNAEFAHPVEFLGNLGLERGGGAYFEQAGYKTSFYEAHFDSNAASFGGGLAFTDCESMKLGGLQNGTYFYRNTALIGGAVHIELRNITEAHYEVRHTRISYNEALDWKKMTSKSGSTALKGWQQLEGETREVREEGGPIWPTCDQCDYGLGGGFYIKVNNFDKIERVCRFIQDLEVDNNVAILKGDDGIVEVLNKKIVYENLAIHRAYICVE